MITIPEIVERVVRESPLLEEGLVSGILNLSALARQIRKQVERESKKPAGEGAIVMALKRLTPRLKSRLPALRRVIRDLSDLSVRSGIAELTYAASPTLVECQKRLLDEAAQDSRRFVVFTQGANEVTVLLSADLVRTVEKIFRRERLVSRLDGLAALSVRLSPKSVEVPGVYYTVLKQLLWDDVNVVEVVSTLTEFTVILDRRQVDRAFSALSNFLWNA